MIRIFLLLSFLVGLSALVVVGIPMMADRSFGPPGQGMTRAQVLQYSARLLWADGLLTSVPDSNAPEVDFEVRQGEDISSLCERLEDAGVIREASVLRDYLIYTGLDKSVQAGAYRVSARMSIIEVAQKFQDATPSEVTFVILPGWRIEEIAASLPTSGLGITPEEFVSAASAPPSGFGFLAGASTAEGFLYPDSYVLPRATTLTEMIEMLIRNFSLHNSIELREGYDRQGLSLYEAVTLASIVQREAVQEDEAPTIASVYLNRLAIAMRLDADPTVQYARGFNAAQNTWWTNPLSLEDLQLPSAYNTYVNNGLPPAPISNPGLVALQAVAAPSDSPYYYFSARCDDSGYHNFAQTYDEHLRNLCP